MRRARRLALLTSVCSLVLAANAGAQGGPRLFAGILAGVSTLSADSRAVTMPPAARVSLYTPENGPAIDLFAGWHASRYFSVQANYVWNRNAVTLVSSIAEPPAGGAYEQRRTSEQHAFVVDGLLYFRGLTSRVRPYLGTGLAVVHFSSRVASETSAGLAAPAGRIAATGAALRSHVGIDVAISPAVAFRYSFSETIGANPISPHLTPPGHRGLANFQNLFGLVARF